MDVDLLQLFKIQIADQCRIILLEEREIERALELCTRTPVGNDLVWVHLQNLLNAAANVAKALYGQGGSKKEERKALRESLGIVGDSKFWGVSMRNNYEHIDERLERWANESTTHSFVDKEIGPSHLTSGTDEIDLFRFFDPETWVTGFWGQRFDVRAVIDEAARLMPPLDEEDYVGAAPPMAGTRSSRSGGPAYHGAEPPRPLCPATHDDSDGPRPRSGDVDLRVSSAAARRMCAPPGTGRQCMTAAQRGIRRRETGHMMTLRCESGDHHGEARAEGPLIIRSVPG